MGEAEVLGRSCGVYESQGIEGMEGLNRITLSKREGLLLKRENHATGTPYSVMEAVEVDLDTEISPAMFLLPEGTAVISPKEWMHRNQERIKAQLGQSETR